MANPNKDKRQKAMRKAIELRLAGMEMAPIWLGFQIWLKETLYHYRR
jgi:hypothetical protein